jgi:hypothetical protein
VRKGHWLQHRQDVHGESILKGRIVGKLANAAVRDAKVLGAECPPTLTSMEKLARPLHSQDELKEKALEVRKNIANDDRFGNLEPENSENGTMTSSSHALSVFSGASTISSFSINSTEELPAIKHWFVLIFANDQRLQLLYLSALKNPSIGAVRFENNFRQLLKRYAPTFRNEAQGAPQKNVTLMVRLYANDIIIAIRSRFDPKTVGVSERIEWLKKHSSDPGNLMMLDRYMNEFAARGQDSRKMGSSDAHCQSKDLLVILI